MEFEQETTEEMAQVQAKPEVSKAHIRSNVRFVVIGEGQGGSSIASVLKATLPNSVMIAVNTSSQDMDQLNIPNEFKFKIGGERANGAGKNRALAKHYFDNFEATNTVTGEKVSAIDSFMGYYENILFHPTMQTIIICCFSSDGGTGSGLGPKLVTSLAYKMKRVKSFDYDGNTFVIDDNTKLIPRPVVVGLTPKCAVNAGVTNLQNTIECFGEIQKAIEAGLGNWFIADNNLPSSVSYQSTEEMYRIINARIAAPLVKFLGIELNSSIKCMDLQDKVNTLRIPGASSFVSLTRENIYQYVEPRGQKCARVVTMLKQDETGAEERAAKDLIRKMDVSFDDKQEIFFETEKTGLNGDVNKDLLETSMIGFFGYDSLNAIVEDLKDNLHRILTANDKKRATIKAEARGFDSIAEDNQVLANRFGGADDGMSEDDLKNLF